MHAAAQAALDLSRAGRDAWGADATGRAAMRFHLAALGSAAGRAPDALRQRDSAIPWDAMARFPGLLEDPWGVSDEAVWGAAVALGPLLAKLDALAGDRGGPEVA